MWRKYLDSSCIEAADVVDGIVFNHPHDDDFASSNEGHLLQFLCCLVTLFTNGIHLWRTKIWYFNLVFQFSISVWDFY